MLACKNISFTSIIHSILSAVFVLNYSFGQELAASVNRANIQLGEPIVLNLSVSVPKNTKISFNPYDKELPALQQKEGGQVNDNKISLEIEGEFKDSTSQEKNKVTWIGHYTLMVWDTGKITIPMQQIIINDSTYLFNAVAFTVSSKTIGAKDELFDIEESFIDVPQKTFIQYLEEYWYVAVGCVLLLAFATFYIYKKRKKHPVKPQKIMSLKERTLFAIEALDNEKMWEKGKLKQHYTELSHIMRSYMSGRFGLNLLETTTFETKKLLKQVDLQDDTIETYLLLLRQADMVKFAKSTTDEYTILKISMMAKQLIAETSPLEV
ncbi:MAG: BatD family protein [Crocinitomicaceae bacterium]|nr:BatD family protein [Crocinitomicaceae bacterium]